MTPEEIAQNVLKSVTAYAEKIADQNNMVSDAEDGDDYTRETFISIVSSAYLTGLYQGAEFLAHSDGSGSITAQKVAAAVPICVNEMNLRIVDR